MSTTRTIAVTGTSEQDTARIASLLERHRHKLSTSWAGAQASEADLLIVDIETTHGQMDWLRARSRGRLVIAYTSAAEPLEPEFSLRKPVLSGELVALLNRLSDRIGGGNAEPPAPMQPANAETYEPIALSIVPAPLAPPVEAQAEPANEAIESTPETFLVDALIKALDADGGPVRLVCEGLPSIILDPARERWYAGVGLKALVGWAKQPLRRDQPIHLTQEEFAKAVEILPAQPYSRLVWLAHFARSEGNLDAGLPPMARYQLTRWPLVEREFPKHFRIATAMMRGTGTITDIATQSAAGIADVVDFINAYHALGYIECEATLPVTAPNDRSGLLRRVRESLRN